MNYWIRFSTCAFLFFCFSSLGQAQILEEDQKTYVHRGFSLSFETGAYFLVVKPTTLSGNGNPESNTLGLIGGLELGYDVNAWLTLYISALGAHTQGNPQIGGGNSSYMFAFGANFSAYRSEQLHLFAKVGIGAILVTPSSLYPLGLIAEIGMGIRYYTRLTGFSLGVELLAFFAPPLSEQGLQLGIGLQPFLSYTF